MADTLTESTAGGASAEPCENHPGNEIDTGCSPPQKTRIPLGSMTTRFDSRPLPPTGGTPWESAEWYAC